MLVVANHAVAARCVPGAHGDTELSLQRGAAEAASLASESR